MPIIKVSCLFLEITNELRPVNEENRAKGILEHRGGERNCGKRVYFQPREAPSVQCVCRHKQGIFEKEIKKPAKMNKLVVAG